MDILKCFRILIISLIASPIYTILSVLSIPQPYFQALASGGHRLTLVTWVQDTEFCNLDNVECVRVGVDLSSLMESKNFFTGDMTIFGEDSY